MPAAAQDIALWLCVTILAVFVVIAVRMSAKHKTLLPVLFLIAGFCTIVLEPIACHLGHAFHPEIGRFTLFKNNKDNFVKTLGIADNLVDVALSDCVINLSPNKESETHYKEDFLVEGNFSTHYGPVDCSSPLSKEDVQSGWRC